MKLFGKACPLDGLISCLATLLDSQAAGDLPEVEATVDSGTVLRQAMENYRAHTRSFATLPGKDAPQFRRTQACAEGKVVEIREVGGLHHHYESQAA